MKEFLSRVSIFSRLRDEDLQRIQGLVKKLHFTSGQIIIREGETDGRLFIIISGQVEVIKGMSTENQRFITKMGPYEYFGEMSLVDSLPRSATVRAIKDTTIIFIERNRLLKEMAKSPQIGIELLRILSLRIRAIEKYMIKALGGLIPICSNCKKVRDIKGEWIPIERYISDHSDAEFSHGLCPTCIRELYPEMADRILSGDEKDSSGDPAMK
jgi:hypothetical protein